MLAIAAALGAVALLGGGSELILYRPLRRIATCRADQAASFGVAFIVYGGAHMLFACRKWEGVDIAAWCRARSLLVPGQQGLQLIFFQLLIPLGLVGLAFMLGIFFFCIYRTWLGLGMRAVVQDRTAARLLGIEAGRMILGASVAGAVLAGMAGLLYSCYCQSLLSVLDFTFFLKALAVFRLGGGRWGGVVLAGLGQGLLETLVRGYLATSWDGGIIWGLIVILLWCRSSRSAAGCFPCPQ